MKFFHSIRWRLQLWHGLMLAVVLTALGVTAWQLDRITQLQRLDQELERHVGVINERIRWAGEVPGRPPRGRPPQGQPPQDRPPQGRPPQGPLPQDRPFAGPLPPPQDAPEPERDASAAEDPTEGPFYFVAWDPAGRELSRSASAPPDVPRPERAANPSQSRLRGTLREYVHFTPAGTCVLVGRDIRDDVANMRRLAWLLTEAGAAVLLLGLAGGWWITTRALRPIGDITATATAISTGDLTQRIQTTDTGSELGALAGVLNDTFARLQVSFARQAQFTADASHELRTPVSVVLTQAQGALARERSGPEYRETLAACQRAAQRMRRLTDSLLTLARLDSGENNVAAEPCDLGRIAAEAADPLRPIAEQHSVALTTDVAEAPCTGDVEQLGQVVANLVSNAVYYNRPGGRVDVRVRSEAGAAVLSVSDTGLGIAPEDLPHVFERFYRTDRSQSGAHGRAGLGLAITRAIVEAHGGSIQAASEPGRGSTFTVRLPSNR